MTTPPTTAAEPACLHPVCPEMSHPKGHPHCLPPGQACGVVADLGLGPCLEVGPHDEHRDRTGASWRARRGLDVETGVRLREITDLIDELVRGCGLSPFSVKIDAAAAPLVQLTQYLEQQVAGVAEALTGGGHDHRCPVDCGPAHDAAMDADADRQLAAADRELPDVDERLTWLLRVLGDEFGPRGVVSTARELWPVAARLDVAGRLQAYAADGGLVIGRGAVVAMAATPELAAEIADVLNECAR